MPNQSPAQRQVRAALKEKIGALHALEASLTARAAAAYSSPTGLQPVSARERAIHDRAKKLLNGHGQLLADLPGVDATEGDVLAERKAVRLALATLDRADVEAAATEALEKAEGLAPEWAKQTAAWTAAYRTFLAAERAAQKFRDGAGVECMAILANHPAGQDVRVELPEMVFQPFAGPQPPTAEEVVAMTRAARGKVA